MRKRLHPAALAAALLLAAAPAASRAAETAQSPMAVSESAWFDESRTAESATRVAKPLSQTAENVTIITAAEIEAMNAHNLNDVLARVPGVFVDYVGQEMNGIAWGKVLGSRAEHVLVLIDGVRLNSAMSGDAQLYVLHPSIVDHIEVIKGPASSAWGSSLGGVVNIFTKKAGRAGQFSGAVAGSWGAMETGDGHGELAGGFGKLGFYVNAARQDSDGLENRRFFRSDDLYAKLSLDLPHATTLTGTFGYGDPFSRLLRNPVSGNDNQIDDRLRFFTLGLDSRLGEGLSLYLGARHLTRDFDYAIRNAGTDGNYPGAALDEFIYEADWGESAKGLNGQLSYTIGQHSLALGGEVNRSKADKQSVYGGWAQTNWGSPATDAATPAAEETRGVYASDTIRLGAWTLTPGLRYDSHSVTGGLLSPSLGATWRVTDATLLRAQAVRGFVQPVLSYLGVSDLYYTANPDLGPEKITSWQAGVETAALPYLHAKATLFLHQVDEEWVDGGGGAWMNGGAVERQGAELEAETARWRDFSARANYTYVYIIPDDARPNDSTQVANLILRYDRPERFFAELAGHYVWWDEFYTVSAGSGRGECGPVLWDLNLSREFATGGVGKKMKVFAAGHNLFDGRQTSNWAYSNPGRWVEAGMKWSF